LESKPNALKKRVNARIPVGEFGGRGRIFKVKGNNRNEILVKQVTGTHKKWVTSLGLNGEKMIRLTKRKQKGSGRKNGPSG